MSNGRLLWLLPRLCLRTEKRAREANSRSLHSAEIHSHPKERERAQFSKVFKRSHQPRGMTALGIRARPRRTATATAALATSSFILVAAFFFKLTDQLRFETVQMPSLVQRGTNFWLSCQFKLQPDQQLYSVKWYKNNEEFYRLLVASGVQQQQPAAAAAPFSGNEIVDPPLTEQHPAQQQQYFSQSGINVLMSSSNATHVRLLNASLDSEGFYACEISTQNLSSIRYEREIRVYVLPQSRLSVIGFKSGYNLGERLDLACTSDYSRPRPALAWFINNQLIRDQQPAWFTLESQNKSKLNEPTLFKQTLSLKFKLTPELLRWLSTQQQQQPQGGSSSPNPRRRGGSSSNQSLAVRPELASYQQQQQQQLQFRMQLQCKYKLTEVSDLTFNELLVRQKSPTDRKQATATRPWSWPSNAVTVGKLPDNRLNQSKCPATRNELRAALVWRPPRRQRPADADAECRLGQLALQPDDPLLVGELAGADQGPESVASSSPSTLSEVAPGEDTSDDRNDDSTDNDQSNDESGRRRRQVIGAASELAVGDALSVDCSTISALVGAANELSSGSPMICWDSEARRRSIISGKYQTRAEQDTNQRQSSASSQQHWTLRPSSNRSGGGGKLASQLLLSRRQFESLGQQQMNADQRRALSSTPAAAGGAESTLLSGPNHGESAAGNQLEAPPLLEWFINNQEVESAPIEGAPGQSLPQQTIDYVSYFANFDSKPIQQELSLRLNVTKKHFMSQDSNLRLRCSSTQAQVLVAESITLDIWPTLIQTDTEDGGNQQLWQQKRPRPSSDSKRAHSKQHLMKPSNLDRSKLIALDGSNSAAPTNSLNFDQFWVVAVSVLWLLAYASWQHTSIICLNKITVISSST